MKSVLEKQPPLDSEYYDSVFTIPDKPGPSLCETCIHQDNCIYRQKGNEVKYTCDDFETLGAEKQHHRPVAKTDRSAPEETYTGLCANCEYRHTCSLSTTETGIWFCEEYK